MNGRSILIVLLGFVFLATTFNAEAGRRSLRIDFGDWTEGFTLGTADCPGSSPGSPSVFWSGIQFNSGSSVDGAYSVDEYCQQSLETFSEDSLFFEDDAGLADKVGPNDDPDPLNRVTGIRFTFLDRDRFSQDPLPTGYQWEFYFFPGNETLVRLNGEVPIPGGVDFSPFIQDGVEIIWDSEVSGYDGEYWCFDNDEFAGLWDGEPAGSSALDGCGFASEGLALGPQLNGGWFNPDTSGQGFFLDISADQNFLFAGWFTYKPDAPTEGDVQNHRWYTIEGNLDSESGAFPVYLTSDGVFNDPRATTSEIIGEASFQVINCNNAIFGFEFDEGESGSMSITRLLPVDESECDEL